MAATIVVQGETATITSSWERGWFWEGSSPILVQYLNAQLDPGGPLGQSPDPLGGEAERMANLLHGRVVERDEIEYVPGRVY